MLANAIRDQKKDAAQQILTSSSPPQLPPSGQDYRKSLDGRREQVSGLGGQQVLQLSSAALNRHGRLPAKPFKNPLKRSSSEFSGIPESGGMNKVRKFSGQGKQQNLSRTLSRQDSGLLGKLHSDFAFDEDEFDEDEMLTLASDSSFSNLKQEGEVKYPELKMEPRYPELPLKHETPKTPSGKWNLMKTESNSSAPLPWSSSPDFHRLPAQQALGYKKTAPVQGVVVKEEKKSLFGRQLQLASSDPPSLTQLFDSDRDLRATIQTLKPSGHKFEPIEIDDGPEPTKEKRRTLPWASAKDEEQDQAAEGASRRMKRPKKEKSDSSAPPTSTPVAKTENPAQLWEQTASAVKAEQKKFRQQRDAEISAKSNAQESEEGQPGAVQRKLTTATKSMSPVFLSEEQQRVLNLVVEKQKSVFFTGSAGTGKSVLMREIISALRKKYERSGDSVAVTASTGLAACNIGGTTVHSFAGIGLGAEPAEQLIKKIRKNGKALQRWQRTKVLVIDEISMIDGSLFDKLEQIARVIRKKPKAFGGIQLVITGDFFQLPPVARGGEVSTFTFDAATWKTAIDHTIGLTHVFRQKDPVFAGMLNEMRVGKLTPASIQAFQRLNRPIADSQDTEATELFPTRNEVEMANTVRMKRLGGEAREFPALDAGTMQDLNQRNKLLANCMAPQNLILKKGAQVMLIKNIDDQLVNGSIGKVVAFMDEQTFDYYDEHEEEFLSTAPNKDAISAAAKSKDGSSSFTDEVKKFLFPNGEPSKKSPNISLQYPVVRFQAADGTTRDLLCQPESWKIEQPNGEVLASRSQVPLILAWALSIHKAQGQTLEKVKVDLGRIFEKGQAYVALSRATTQEGLQIARFDPRKVMAHEKVRRFYDTLYGVDTIGGMPKTVVAPAPMTATTISTLNGGAAISAEDEKALLEMGF